VKLLNGELNHIRHELLLDHDNMVESLDKSDSEINSYNLSEVEDYPRPQSHPFLSRSDSLYLLYFSVFDSNINSRS
jgi:hypothetical protein